MDVRDYFVSAVVQEHLLSPFVRAKVEVNQYEGMQGSLTGEKKSGITFSTPEGKKRRYSELAVNNVGNYRSDQAQRSRNFVAEMLSSHALGNNATPNYQKSFRNIQISDMVSSVLKDGLNVKIPVNIDPTKGLQGSDYQPIILTQKSPLMHIEDLRRMAVSDKNYDGFMMFSGIGGSGGEEIFFKNVYDMLKGSPVSTITNMTNFEINSDLQAETMHNAIEVFVQTPLGAMEKGPSFGVGTTKYDVQKGVATVPSLDFGRDRQRTGSSTSLNPGNVSYFVNDPVNGMPGTSSMVLEDSRRPDTTRAETAPYTDSLFSDMKQNFLTVKLPGNSNYRLGDIVNFEFRENTDNFLNKDTQFYGKNMVIGMTHYIGPLSDRPRYVTYLDLVNIQTYNGKVS